MSLNGMPRSGRLSAPPHGLARDQHTSPAAVRPPAHDRCGAAADSTPPDSEESPCGFAPALRCADCRRSIVDVGNLGGDRPHIAVARAVEVPARCRRPRLAAPSHRPQARDGISSASAVSIVANPRAFGAASPDRTALGAFERLERVHASASSAAGGANQPRCNHASIPGGGGGGGGGGGEGPQAMRLETPRPQPRAKLRAQRR